MAVAMWRVVVTGQVVVLRPRLRVDRTLPRQADGAGEGAVQEPQLAAFDTALLGTCLELRTAVARAAIANTPAGYGLTLR